MSYVLWDMDGVMIPGRGTTHLANGYAGDPNVFRARFLNECGKDGTPLYVVKAGELADGFGRWEEEYNGGKRIATIGELAACLTDMRHKLKVFPGADQTIYTKNAILEGLTMQRIKEIAEELPYNPGVEDAVQRFHGTSIAQYLFSNSNAALVDAVGRKFHFEYKYNEAASPEVRLSHGVTDYFNGFYGRPDVTLTGRMNDYNKSERVIGYFDAIVGCSGFDYREFYAIDDTEIGMLLALRERGANVFGFYNPDDTDMKPRDLDEMKANGIPVIEGDVTGFADAVLRGR
jgi:hypothetical protein